MMFARLDFPRFLVCCSRDLSDNESEEKPSVAICGGSICILTGLYRSQTTTADGLKNLIRMDSSSFCDVLDKVRH